VARATVTYEPSFEGIGQLLTSPEMEAMVRSATEKGARYARSISPRRSGDYASAFRVWSTRNGGPRRNRAEGRLYNDARYWWTVEYVNGDRVMGRTVDYIEANGP
jgi:hypothetical protein